jgi:hypothetical protein
MTAPLARVTVNNHVPPRPAKCTVEYVCRCRADRRRPQKISPHVEGIVNNDHVSKHEVARKLRHEINNDLNVIVMSVAALPLVRDDAAEFDQVLEAIRSNVDALKGNVAAALELCHPPQ